ncbi:MAG: hypothetical protein M1822_006073 [Bathelium mastoideum]|nr:MAG: hypothetical protein M1822_006073 [Bathelium mastoideum]
MSKALARASHLKPEIRLAQAVKEFEASLTSEQKAEFVADKSRSQESPPDEKDVVRFMAEIDRSCKRGRGKFGRRMTTFVRTIQQFVAVGDVLVGSSQNVFACGLWTVVRISLLAVVVHDEYLETASNLIMVIGRGAPRYQNMALLYPHSRTLQSHFVEYLIVVVRLCSRLLSLTKKPTIAKIASTFSDSDLKNFRSELERLANDIKEEVDLLVAKDIQELPKIKAVLSSDSKSANSRRKFKEKLRVLDSCSKYNFETPWRQMRKIGTTTLFHQYPEYQHWKDQAESCTLVLTGKLGAGKSVLLANIVDDLHISIQERTIPIAYFFCRHDINESLKARAIFGSLVRQVLGSISDLTVAADFLDEHMFDPDLESLSSLLLRTLPPNHEIYFVLDGLDECSSDERDLLIKRLCKLQEFFVLHLCISLRLEPSNVGTLTTHLQHFLSRTEISLPVDNPEIESFIQCELESRIQSGNLNLGDPALVIEIYDALVKGSQGMFLWAALQINTICSMPTDESIRRALSNLPKDLSETFSRILQKSENIEEAIQRYQKRVMELLITVIRPLSIEELRQALSVVIGDIIWRPDRLLNDVVPILGTCGGLVVVEEEELTVHLVHHSVKQFLISEFKDPTGGDFSGDRAAKATADIIVTYLNYGVFGNKISTGVVPKVDVGAVPSRIIESTQNSLTRRKMALKVLQSRKLPNFDISRIVAETTQFSDSGAVDDLPFYNYAKLYCLDHVLRVPELDPAEYRLLVRLFRENLIDTDSAFRGGQQLLDLVAVSGTQSVLNALLDTGRLSSDLSDELGRTPLHCAAWKGKNKVVRLLLNSNKVDANSRDKFGWTPLCHAVSEGHQEVVSLLLDSNKVDANSRDNGGWTPLRHAVSVGHQEVVSLFLDSNKVDANSRDNGGWTPLCYAALMGRQEMVRLLLDSNKVDANSRDNQGWTPLCHAASKGHQEVVSLLLDFNKVDANSRDNGGWTPLCYAALMGRQEMVRLLLDSNKVYANSKDNRGWTPLCHAASKGHQEVVRLLLDSNKVGANSRDNGGWTPLCHAASKGHQEVVRLLLDSNKVGANSRDNQGWTPLCHAASEGHQEVVSLLLDFNKVDANLRDNEGWTPLWHAVSVGHQEVVSLFLDSNKVDANSRDNGGWTPLCYAALMGRQEMVRLLLDSNKVDANSRDNQGWTPLCHAASKGHQEVVSLLLDFNKVDANSRDNGGWTPLCYAALMGRQEMVRLLLDSNKVYANLKDNRGWTPLCHAASKGHQEVVRLLLDSNKVGANSRDNRGWTPLCHAASKGHQEVVRLLLNSNKVYANSKDNRGWTPLCHAASKGHQEVVRLLLDSNKVGANSRDNQGWTPLCHAASEGHQEVVSLLLDFNKVDANLRDNEGWTPLWHAVSVGHQEVVSLFLDSSKVDLNSRGSRGWTQLARAVTEGHQEVVRVLLDSGKVDADAKDDCGRTPLSWAAVKRSSEEVVKLLLDSNKVDADSKDKEGRTPLSWAMATPFSEKIVQLLLDSNKVDVNSEDNQGRTPLSWAAAEVCTCGAIERLLRTKRVHVHSRDHLGRTPLSWAQITGHRDVVLLLDYYGNKQGSSNRFRGKRWFYGQ